LPQRPTPRLATVLTIDVWSDLACPWCYLGKRYLELALETTGLEAEVRFRSFELDPTMAADPGYSIPEMLATKYGMSTEEAAASGAHLTGLGAAVDLEYNMSEVRPGNTVDAHRLIKYAELRGRGEEMLDALFADYFANGVRLSDHESLADTAVRIGFDRTEVLEFLAGDELLAMVRRDEAEAAGLGISSVPTFVIDSKFGIPGAQDPETMGRLLMQAASKG